ncbi:MAG: hypothetical protein O3B92_02270 [Actinobacteria bacterium]|nr:hypothetical protein [Actinomycetota bacterium]MDA3017841.1 hypothetical protein [Actinomycetota bacterium]
MKRIALLTVVVAIFLTFQTSLVANATSPDTSTPAVYDLENEPSECIGFLPKPGCGKEPQDAGERGGTLQYLVFAIMIIGLTVVGVGITRGVRKKRPTKQ